MEIWPAVLVHEQADSSTLAAAKGRGGELSITRSAQPELEWNGNYPVNHSNLYLRKHDAQL